MFTIIGADGKEYGPVSAEKLREWIAAGRANSQTQCRRDGETAWSTLGSLPDFAGSFGAALPPSAGASPAASAPAAAGATIMLANVDSKAYADAIRASGARIDVFECLSRAFKLWTSNFLPLVGATFLVIVVQLVIGLIPLVGSLAGLFLNGVFYGGLYYFYLGKMRGEHREIGDVFGGFTRALGPLVLCSLLQSAIAIAVLAIFMAPWIGFIIQMMVSQGQGDYSSMPTLAPGLIALTGVGMLVMLYIGVSMVFAFALVIDKGLGPWTAIVTSWRVVTRNWFSTFFVLLLGVILGLLGVIALFIGIVLTIPITIAALLYAYESLFNAPNTPAVPTTTAAA
ncbi:MAG: hypothetical protein C0518_03160 [Opitutus sp.]|nr:hypothetical protein [Opitutus sp.]